MNFRALYLKEKESYKYFKPYCFTLSQLLLRSIKIKVNIQAFHKLCDRVPVCVGLLSKRIRNNIRNQDHGVTQVFLIVFKKLIVEISPYITLKKKLNFPIALYKSYRNVLPPNALVKQPEV